MMSEKNKSFRSIQQTALATVTHNIETALQKQSRFFYERI